MSSPGYYGKKELNRRLKGMRNNNKDESSSPLMDDLRRRLESADPANTRSNRRELRFLKEKSPAIRKSKTKDTSLEIKSKKRSKTNSRSTEIPQPVSPTPPPTVAATPSPTPLARGGERTIVLDHNDDDGLLN